MGKRYAVATVPPTECYGAWLAATVRQYEAPLLVVDVRDALSRQALQAIRSGGALVAVIDDLSERRLAADLAFYPPIPQVQEANWSGFTGKIFSGWEWVILRPDIPRPAHFDPPVPKRRRDSLPSLLVTMGGSDPAGLTLRAVRALELADLPFTATVMLGPGFAHQNELDHLLSQVQRRFTVRRDFAELPSAMACADLALCSFGVTAYELAVAGIPGIYLCLTLDHAQSASALEAAGMGASLGVFDTVTDSKLAAAVQGLLINHERLGKMRDQACRHMDGRGVARVARNLVDHLSLPIRRELTTKGG
jgi:spore coat polysaccharide biosynthesis protein SpsF